jgi:hypothetical protein
VQSFQDSVNFCVAQNVPIIHAFPLMLLRGTPLFENKDALELVESTDIASSLIPRVQDNVIPHVVRSKSFSYDDWKEMAKIAEWLETVYNNRRKNF